MVDTEDRIQLKEKSDMQSDRAWFIPEFGRVVVRLCAVLPAVAQPEKSKTAAYVKVQAVTDDPDGAGRQAFTISLEIDEKYFLIGDRVPGDLEELRFRVEVVVN